MALYHNFTSAEYTEANPLPNEWHRHLEKWILGDDSMFGCDVYNSGAGDDTVWNYPIYAIDSAQYKEKAGQSDEKVVEITCEVKYWDAGAESLYYWYYVTYGTDGVASSSTESDWKEHPDAPASHKRPDAIFMPNRQTSIGAYWNGQLDYNTIKSIIPLN